MALEVSDFIAQECEDLREKYHRLLAEATISGVNSRSARIRLISDFGYQTSLPKALPLIPLIVIFAVDFASSVIPVFSMPKMSEDYRVSATAALLAALAHAIGLTLSVVFAVFPKASTNFARPSLFWLPWRSYVLFGLASYLAGNAILGVTYSSIARGLGKGWPAHDYPFETSSLFALIFLINTVVLSILLDMRLRNESLDYDKDRFRDGATVAVVMMSLMSIFIAGFYGLVHHFGLPPPPLHWYDPVFAESIFFFGVLGFVMGYVVPSTAQAYLEANKSALQWTEKQGMSIGWATQRSHPEAPVVS